MSGLGGPDGPDAPGGRAHQPHPPTPGTARRLRVVAAVFAFLLAGGLVLTLVGGDLDAVRRTVADSGPLGPLVYLALHVLLTLVPVPKNLLAGIAGAVFGLGAGVALSWLGAVLSAVVTFWLARRLGHDTVAALTGPRVERVRRVLRERGVLSVLVARLTPLVPFTVVNYGAGVSPVTLRDYVVGTAVGIVPGSVAYAAVGASAGQDTSTVVWSFAAGLALLAVTLLAARFARRG